MTPGYFWAPETPGVRERGEFTAEVGEEPAISLNGALVPDFQPTTTFIQGDIASMLAVHAERSVAEFQPITVHGQLDSGESITLLDARNHGTRHAPRYIGQAVVFDALVSPDEVYTAIRFNVGHVLWLSHLTDGESAVVDEGESTLGVESSDAGNWLVYESSNAATLRELEIRVISGCLALMHLVLHPDARETLVACETQVRCDPDGPWLNVRGPMFSAEHGAFQADTLLPASELTIERFAGWIPLNDHLDGLSWAVATPLEVPVQAETQVLTSLIEGLHRRLPFEQSAFPNVPEDTLATALKSIRRAATDAAEAKARELQIDGLDPALVSELVRRAVGHVGEVSYRDRARDVIAKVTDAVPEIDESVKNLPGRLTDPRNLFAHQLPQHSAKKKTPLEERWNHWTAISTITPWLLRLLLLLNMGVDPLYLHEKCLENHKFAFFRENIAQIVKELGWDLPADDSESDENG
jgi:hypothetical protein